MVPESEDPIVAARGMLKRSGILKAYIKFTDNFRHSVAAQ